MRRKWVNTWVEPLESDLWMAIILAWGMMSEKPGLSSRILGSSQNSISPRYMRARTLPLRLSGLSAGSSGTL